MNNTDKIKVIKTAPYIYRDTVDEYVESLLAANLSLITPNNVCHYIIQVSPEKLLEILTSETNKPSMYDIDLIKCIIKMSSAVNTNRLNEIYKSILSVYRDRK